MDHAAAPATPTPTAEAAPPGAAIALPERLTMGEARRTLAQLQQALAAAPVATVQARTAARGAAADAVVVLDAAALRVLDSAALAVLLDCARSARARGARLQLQRVPPKLADLARLYGVDALLGV